MNTNKPNPEMDVTDHIHMETLPSAATWDYVPDPEVVQVMNETEELSNDEAPTPIELHNSESPVLSGGDVDADWGRANEAGEETVGGSVATPGQNQVDELGEAWGVEYQDDEPIQTQEKIDKRDRDRWELNPASKDQEEQI